MSESSDLSERTERVLRKYGLDLCENFLLDTARLESPAPRAMFAQFSKNLCDGDPRGRFTLEQYEEGLGRLLQRRLLAVVSPSTIEMDSVRNRQAGIPELRRKTYRGEDVDFSQEGFDLNENVLREIHGAGILKRTWAGFNIDSVAQRIDVYAMTSDDCWRSMDRFLDPHRPMFGKSDHRYVVAQRPSPIGAWSPKRFITIPSGFHGVLTYTIGPGAATKARSR
jgi:hypothetical protein